MPKRPLPQATVWQRLSVAISTEFAGAVARPFAKDLRTLIREIVESSAKHATCLRLLLTFAISLSHFHDSRTTAATSSLLDSLYFRLVGPR